jgi:hypothetical protein
VDEQVHRFSLENSLGLFPMPGLVHGHDHQSAKQPPLESVHFLSASIGLNDFLVGIAWLF